MVRPFRLQLFALLPALTLFLAKAPVLADGVASPEKPSSPAIAAAAPLEDHYFDSDGVQIHYFVKGEGEPVLLIHGFSASAQLNWIGPKVFDKLAEDHKVVALDNRGHGKSGKPHEPGSYGIKMVGDSIALLDHLGIAKAHVVGYSMGGFITMKLISLHPERVISATVGGAGWSDPEGPRLQVINDLADSLEQGRGFAPLINYLTPDGRPPMTQQQLDSMTKMMSMTNDIKALAMVARENKTLLMTEEEVRAIKVPVLGIAGELDPLKRDTTDNLPGRIKDLRSVSIPGADHMNAFTRPEFIDEVRSFIAQHRQ